MILPLAPVTEKKGRVQNTKSTLYSKYIKILNYFLYFNMYVYENWVAIYVYITDMEGYKLNVF